MVWESLLMKKTLEEHQQHIEDLDPENAMVFQSWWFLCGLNRIREPFLIWLVVEPTPLKKMTSSIRMRTLPRFLENMKFMLQSPPTTHDLSIFVHLFPFFFNLFPSFSILFIIFPSFSIFFHGFPSFCIFFHLPMSQRCHMVPPVPPWCLHAKVFLQLGRGHMTLWTLLLEAVP